MSRRSPQLAFASWVLSRQMTVQDRKERTDEIDRVSLGARVAVANRRDHAHQRAVAPMQPQAVQHEVGLAPVLAGHYSPVALVPIENETRVEAFLNRVAI